jgi:penicillin-binding protein 2
MTGIQEGIMRATDVVTNECIKLTIANPSDPDHPYEYDNWRADLGPFDLRRAIAQSCNIYFFIVGGGYGQTKGLGVLRIAAYLKQAFADVVLGIDIPGEEHGFVPTPDWKQEQKHEPWYQGDTYNISIGQGDLVVTPLWLNAYISAIANGGTILRPYVVDRVTSADGTVLHAQKPEVLGKLPFSPAVIALMQNAMRETVVSGTGKILQDVGVDVSAKTGTAEVVKGGRINSLITVFAPAENPRIALTLLIEGSTSNQGYALRATREFLQQYFASPVPTP